MASVLGSESTRGGDLGLRLVETSEHDEVPIPLLAKDRRRARPIVEALPQRERRRVIVSPVGKASRFAQDQRMVGMERERFGDRRVGLVEPLQLALLGGEARQAEGRAGV